MVRIPGRVAIALAGGLLLGCASARPLPVYMAEDEVPCAYEDLGHVSVYVPTLPRSESQERLREEFSEAAVRRGADAVLYGEAQRRASFTDRRDTGQRHRVLGLAIRFTEDECAARPPSAGSDPP